MALSKISKILIQNSKKKVIYKAKKNSMAIGNRKRFPILHFFLTFFNFTEILYGFFLVLFCFRLCTTAGGQLPHNKEMFVVVFFFSIELNYCVLWLQFVWFFSFSRVHGIFLFSFFLVCASVAAGSLITLKCLLLLFSFLIELDIVSCDFRPFFVCIVV